MTIMWFPGTLKYVYNDEDSILILPEDGYYGSDFAYMIELDLPFA